MKINILILTLAAIFSVQPVASSTGYGSKSEKTGFILVAHGGGDEWNSRIEKTIERFNQEYPDILIEPAYLFARGDTPTPQTATDSLRHRGVTKIVVIPFFVSSHSSHYDEVLYIFNKLEKLPPIAGVDHHHTPARIKTDAEIVAITRAIDDSPAAANLLSLKIRSVVKELDNCNLVLVAHGPNSEEHAELWQHNMDSLLSHIAANLKIANAVSLLIRDDAKTSVREQAVQGITEKVNAMAKNGKTYVISLLIARGHLSREIPKMFSDSKAEYIDFNFAEAEGICDYIHDRISDYLN